MVYAISLRRPFSELTLRSKVLGHEERSTSLPVKSGGRFLPPPSPESLFLRCIFLLSAYLLLALPRGPSHVPGRIQGVGRFTRNLPNTKTELTHIAKTFAPLKSQKGGLYF
jgi:hypothetical protein